MHNITNILLKFKEKHPPSYDKLTEDILKATHQPLRKWNILLIISIISIIVFFMLAIVCAYNNEKSHTSADKQSWQTFQNACILLSAISLMTQYFAQYQIDSVTLTTITELQMELWFDLLSYIPHAYIISNANQITELFNNIPTDALYAFTSYNHIIKQIITYTLLIMMVFVIILLVCCVLPVLTAYLHRVADENPNKAGKASADFFRVYRTTLIVPIITAILFFILIYCHARYVSKFKFDVDIDSLINGQNMYQDRLNNHQTLFQYDTADKDREILSRLSTNMLSNHVKTSRGYNHVIYLLIITISMLYVSIMVFEFKNTLQACIVVLSAGNFNTEMEHLITFFRFCLLSIMFIIYININDFCIIFIQNISDRKAKSEHIESLKAYLKQLVNIVQTPHAIQKANIESNGIVFENAAIKFGERIIFESVSVQLQAGVHYFIVGPSGKGKSTIFDTIQGLNLLTEGELFVNKKNILTYTNAEKMNTVAYMRQAVESNTQTLRENLDMRYEEVNEEVFAKVQTIIKDIVNQQMSIRMGLWLYDIYVHDNICVAIADELFAALTDNEAAKVGKIVRDVMEEKKFTLINSDHSKNTINILKPTKIIYLGPTFEGDQSYITILDTQEAIKNTYINQNIPGTHI